MKTLLWKMLFIFKASSYLTGQKFATSSEEAKLKKATPGKISGEFWIGLYKQGTYWKWSGGGYVTKIPWNETQSSTNYDSFVGVCWDGCATVTGWCVHSRLTELPFFCFSTTVMVEKMTWGEALEYCKQTHTTLTSLTSETEKLLTLKEIQQDTITDRVWIGLCFLAGRWLWVDGSPLIYKAWPEGDREHQCPGQNDCGALKKKNGVWENLDCKEKQFYLQLDPNRV